MAIRENEEEDTGDGGEPGFGGGGYSYGADCFHMHLEDHEIELGAQVELSINSMVGLTTIKKMKIIAVWEIKVWLTWSIVEPHITSSLQKWFDSWDYLFPAPPGMALSWAWG